MKKIKDGLYSFDRVNTSCLYGLSGFHHAFSKIDFNRKLIYLDEGGLNTIPVRLTDVDQVQVVGVGELRIIDAQYEWVNGDNNQMKN